jgi:hypothetical protein
MIYITKEEKEWKRVEPLVEIINNILWLSSIGLLIITMLIC